MLSNTNKIPDPQFEKLGLRGWHYFKQKFQAIKSDYDLHGDVVLEKQLGESIDIYKEAFTSVDFLGEIHEIWRERYHYVAKDLKELISFYEWAKEAGISWEDLLPDAPVTGYGTSGMVQVFAISKELYNDIIKKWLDPKRDRALLLLKGEKLYEITVKAPRSFFSFAEITIKPRAISYQVN